MIVKAQHILALLGAVALFATKLSAFEVIDWNNKNEEPVFFHVHIPKTGGTTMSATLPFTLPKLKKCEYQSTLGIKREHSFDFKHFIDNHFDKVMPEGCNFLSYEGGLKWIMDAVVKQGVPRSAIKPLILLRNPMELRLSGLAHMHRHHSQVPSDTIQAEVSGRRHDSYQLTNFQARQLVCGPPEVPETFDSYDPKWKNQFPSLEEWNHHFSDKCEYNLGMATDAVDGAFWVGLTEYYDAGLCVLAYQFGVFNAQRCDCRGANGTWVDQRNSAPHSSKVAVKFSLAEIEALAALNRVDLLLYGHAIERFLSDVRQVERATGAQLLCADRALSR